MIEHTQAPSSNISDDASSTSSSAFDHQSRASLGGGAGNNVGPSKTGKKTEMTRERQTSSHASSPVESHRSVRFSDDTTCWTAAAAATDDDDENDDVDDDHKSSRGYYTPQLEPNKEGDTKEEEEMAATLCLRPTTTTTTSTSRPPRSRGSDTPLPLFDNEGRPTAKMVAIFQGLARYLVANDADEEEDDDADDEKRVNDHNSSCGNGSMVGVLILPPVLRRFYRDCGMIIPTGRKDELAYDVIFKGSSQESDANIAELYHELKLEYYLCPAARRHREGHGERGLYKCTRPTVPGLTTAGFAQWMVFNAQAFPDREAERLARVFESVGGALDSFVANVTEEGQQEERSRNGVVGFSRWSLPAYESARKREKLERAVRRCLEGREQREQQQQQQQQESRSPYATMQQLMVARNASQTPRDGEAGHEGYHQPHRHQHHHHHQSHLSRQRSEDHHRAKDRRDSRDAREAKQREQDQQRQSHVSSRRHHHHAPKREERSPVARGYRASCPEIHNSNSGQYQHHHRHRDQEGGPTSSSRKKRTVRFARSLSPSPSRDDETSIGAARSGRSRGNSSSSSYNGGGGGRRSDDGRRGEWATTGRSSTPGAVFELPCEGGRDERDRVVSDYRLYSSPRQSGFDFEQ